MAILTIGGGSVSSMKHTVATDPPIESYKMWALLIVLATLFIYSPAFKAPFYLDDNYCIAENSNVTKLSYIPSLFAWREGPISSRPTMIASFAINYSIGGLNPSGYHITNVALHVINGLLLLLVIYKTPIGDPQARIMSGLVAMGLFMLHPAQTESVTYASSRSGLLAMMFYLVGITLFINATTIAPGAVVRRMAIATALMLTCMLGAGSKETFATFPAMLLLYDYLFISGKSFRKVAGNWWAHLPGMLSWLYIVYLVLSFKSQPSNYGVVNQTSAEYFLTQLNVHMTYLRLIMLPVGQTFIYDYPIVKSLSQGAVWLSTLAYAMLWAGGIITLRATPILGFCILWFMVTLTPDSSVINLRDVIFEHRLYLPMAGVSVLAGVGGMWLWARHTSWGKGIVAVALLVAFVFGVASYKRNVLWSDEVAFWQDNIERAPELADLRYDLGLVYAKRSEPQMAVAAFEKAIELRPDYYRARYNLALLLMESDPGRAIEQLKIYSERFPKKANPYVYMGNCYMALGKVDEAIVQFIKAAEIRNDAESWLAVADVYLNNKGDASEAIKYIERAVKADPTNQLARQRMQAAADKMAKRATLTK